MFPLRISRITRDKNEEQKKKNALPFPFQSVVSVILFCKNTLPHAGTQKSKGSFDYHFASLLLCKKRRGIRSAKFFFVKFYKNLHFAFSIFFFQISECVFKIFQFLGPLSKRGPKQLLPLLPGKSATVENVTFVWKFAAKCRRCSR